MNIDNNTTQEIILTDTAIEKIMKKCGIENTMVIFKGKDYFVSILKVENDQFDLELHELQKPIKKDEALQLVITLAGKRYLLSLLVSTLRMENGKLIICTKIVGKVNLELRSKLDELYEGLKYFYLGQYNSIFCDEETLQNFTVIPKFKLPAPGKKYDAYIQSVSPNRIEFFTTKDFLKDTSDRYTITISFSSPSENIALSGKIIKKNCINHCGTELVTAVMETEENENLNRRITDYLKKYKEIRSSLSIG